jgi:lipid A 4'-phosphatase
MNWKRELIRFSHVLTILWAFISLYFALEELRADLRPLALTGNWWEAARQLHWYYLMRAFLWWSVPTAVWWGFLYAGCRLGVSKAEPRETTVEEQRNYPSVGLLFVSAVILGTVAAAIFSIWPNLDLAVSEYFYVGRRIFLFDYHIAPVALGIQLFAKALTWVAALCTLLGALIAITTKRRLFGLGLLQWLFIAIVLLIGPGLLVNTVLKEHSGRPRPIHLVQFGGAQTFAPVFHSGICASNCSFVSGEASSIYALGFGVAALARRRRKALMETAVLVGSLVGFIRIGQGGHFLSDVIFAGVFMAIVVAVVYWFLFNFILHSSIFKFERAAAPQQPQNVNRLLKTGA